MFKRRNGFLSRLFNFDLDFTVISITHIITSIICIGYMVLELTGVIYKMAFSMGWPFIYKYYMVQAIASWMGNTNYDSLLAFMLLMIQVILIVIAAAVETIIFIICIILCILLLILGFVFQVSYLILIPLAAVVMNILCTINEYRDQRSKVWPTICIVFSVVSVLCTIHYFLHTLVLVNL